MLGIFLDFEHRTSNHKEILMAVLLEYILKLAIFTTSIAILIQFLISYLDYLFSLNYICHFLVYPHQIPG